MLTLPPHQLFTHLVCAAELCHNVGFDRRPCLKLSAPLFHSDLTLAQNQSAFADRARCRDPRERFASTTRQNNHPRSRATPSKELLERFGLIRSESRGWLERQRLHVLDFSVVAKVILGKQRVLKILASLLHLLELGSLDLERNNVDTLVVRVVIIHHGEVILKVLGDGGVGLPIFV